nr:hypothetical protein Iba_chr02cCG8530 [Ipomoea batatas]GMD58872.1 hypothetical protein Iba_scaffold48364CG0010 [Ipomoea batatas]GMD58873.1 hypothetical protein Iba_scaffold48364CG0020 [Ipomoea batatas]GMD97846.1 hypothetical protein Iba_chr15cCG6480 [Ipomoea batatas]GME01402.1 hypothetical protein Iba_contig1646CG0010 [Ipomoea batatas]
MEEEGSPSPSTSNERGEAAAEALLRRRSAGLKDHRFRYRGEAAAAAGASPSSAVRGEKRQRSTAAKLPPPPSKLPASST